MNHIIRRSPSRSLALVDPFYRTGSMIDEMEAMARNMWDTWDPIVFRTTITPGVDVYEEKDELVAKAEFPGVEKEDLEVHLDDGVLTIKAEKKTDETSEETTYYTRERYYGKYCRSITMPFKVDADKISARFENGVLEVRLPKAEEVKPKQIDIAVK